MYSVAATHKECRGRIISSDITIPLAAAAFGYLLGAIPFGLIFAHLAGQGDVRSQGSGNIGATNVLRLGNKPLAAAVLGADMLKGAAATLIAAQWGFVAAMTAGLGAIIGHILPVWLKFRGGKGVATYLGTLGGLAWPAALVFIAVWLLTAFISRLSSLSAILAALCVPIFLYIMGESTLFWLYALMSALILFTHRTNIQRLIVGSEPRIGAAK